MSGWRMNVYCPRGHLVTARLGVEPYLGRLVIEEPTCDTCVELAKPKVKGMTARQVRRGLKRLEREAQRGEV